MRSSILLSVFLMLAFSAPPAAAADLAKIDRTIAREPAYKGKPKYCLLVLGPEAKTRIWLVMDDNSLYVDRNGDGDLTATGDRATFNEPYGRWESGDIRVPDSKLRYKLSLRTFERATAGVQVSVHEDGTKSYIIGDPDADPLVFAGHPSEAPVAHVAGPPGINLSYYGSLTLRVRVGAPGLGKGAFAALVLPDDVFPVAHIEFPARHPGGRPIAMSKSLKNR